jgi:hypothetical protein
MRNKKWMGILAIALVFGFTVMGCGAFSDMNKVSNYLLWAERVGRSASGPVPLAVKINLDGINWGSLLSTINSAGVYVNLDLSRCVMTNTEFNPGDNGSGYIVSLVLPDTVTSIAGDFNVFSNLASISLPASVDTGGVNPFIGCSSLTFKLKGRGDLSTIEQGKALVRGGELVSYPSVSGSVTLDGITAIGRSAFNGVGLQSISLPSVTSIGIRAFLGCEKLQTVNLPAATTIGEEAFYGNKSLQTLNIPAVVTIGNNALANTGDANLTITIGQQIETIGTELFFEVGERKDVTVKVPQSEVENVTAMRDAIRGRGWSEGAFTLAAGRNQVTGSGWYQRTVWVNNFNSYINLTVEGY